MNKLTEAKRAAILKALIEGNSVRSTARLTGTAKASVLKLLVEVGQFASMYQDHLLRNLPCTRIQADEIWAFVGAKEKHARQEGQGDLWTFTAICPDTKLIVTWLVGPRTPEAAVDFLVDLKDRLANRIQLTTDGHAMYVPAVEKAFGYNRVDFAQLAKRYGPNPEEGPGRRYSPMICTGAVKERIMGNPDMSEVSTSLVERQNLSMRMGMRRFTRLTNAFSKKAANHAYAVSLYFMAYNFIKPHGTLTKAHLMRYPQTPAMAAGLTDHVWTVEEMLALMDPKTPLHS
jgi:IS1 family transposase